MVTAAAMHGIDLSWMWGTVDRAGGRPVRVRQVCLVVPGSGKTAMCVLSGPVGTGADTDHRERVAAIAAAFTYLGVQTEREIRLAQALPDPSEGWAVRAFEDSGFLRVGELAYLRRPKPVSTMPSAPPVWPSEVEVRVVQGAGPKDAGRAELVEALDRSYEATLDCPELCGLRETVDVLESHRATGVFDPKLWWIVLLHGRPHGCMLLNRCPDHGTVELVYLGLSPELRARRIGTALLRMGLDKLDAVGGVPVTCAVDLRNAPALRLYERLGFREFGRRVALVRPVKRS
jgi:ribosomal protein S18 acetylase RimI-like enzyme